MDLPGALILEPSSAIGFHSGATFRRGFKVELTEEASAHRSSERSDEATEEGGIQGRRTGCGESRGGYRRGETSESSNPMDGISMKQG
jgi:hypothetical protein